MTAAETNRTKHVLVSDSLDRAIYRLLARLQDATGSNMDFSTLTRALWTLLIERTDLVVTIRRSADPGNRPPKRDRSACEEYEAAWPSSSSKRYRALRIRLS